MKKTAVLLALFAVTSLPVWAAAQSASASPSANPPRYYHLALVVEQVNGAGRIINSRNYQATVATGQLFQSVKTGSRIPIMVAPASNDSSGPPQVQYIDLGVSFIIRDVTELNGSLGFRLKADVSSIAAESTPGVAQTPGDPVIRQNDWDSAVLVPVGKPTIVYSADDLDDAGTMKIQVTATQVQ